MNPSRYDAIRSPFARLRALLGDSAPGAHPIDLSLGGPRHAPPGFVGEIISRTSAEFGLYPPIRGTEALRRSMTGWIARRYGQSLDAQLDPDRNVLPLSGSREGLFSAMLMAVDRRPIADRPAVLIPNPFYQVYAAGALAAGAEPIYLDCRPETGFLPDLDDVPQALLARTVALFLCSPSNPEGAVAEAGYWHRAIELARTHDLMLFADECYSEIYLDGPPPGVLQTAYAGWQDFTNVLAFNSLSKRSSVPGLRSGFVAGDADFLAQFAAFRNVACPQMPLPVQHASEALWRDESHVTANRGLYAKKLELAAELLAPRLDVRLPQGGFFLWLDMSAYGGGETAAHTLWKETGVKVLPGRYLAQAVGGDQTPGDDFIRLALVGSLEETRTALKRLADWLA